MQSEEIDIQLDELENRLDRLRSLYEQYFLGIEKIEPGVARKDVDRRFWILRRIQIRNTARRFRLQTLVQRYNTFQQYWSRICREIENGTYVRHLLKAQKLGVEPKTWAAKKRLGYFRRGEGDGGGAPVDGAPEGLAQLLESGRDLEQEARIAAAEAVGNAERLEAEARAVVSQKRLDDLGPLDLDFDDSAPSHAVPPPPVAKALPHEPKALAPAQRSALPATRTVGKKPPLPTRQTPPRPATSDVPAPGGAASPAAQPAPLPVRTVAAAPAKAVGGAMSPPSPPGGPATSLSDERLRQLHAELVATRRKLKQADNVSMDSLAKSLRDTESRLLAQHQGRSVDFHVVVKDGKPVVKPVVRK